jgi:hypothetical protein
VPAKDGICLSARVLSPTCTPSLAERLVCDVCPRRDHRTRKESKVTRRLRASIDLAAQHKAHEHVEIALRGQFADHRLGDPNQGGKRKVLRKPQSCYTVLFAFTYTRGRGFVFVLGRTPVTEHPQTAAISSRAELHDFIDKLDDDLARPGLHATIDTLPAELVPVVLNRMRALRDLRRSPASSASQRK